MTYRWVVSRIRQLPDDSRWVKHHRREAGLIWDQPDHHRQDAVDLLSQAVYYLQVAAFKGSERSQAKKVQRNAPKRPARPGENQEKPQMSSKEELKEFFSGLT